jgi:archaemetzincin
VNAVYTVTLGKVDGGALSAIELSLWQAFGVEVCGMPALEEPTYAYDQQRAQCNSTEVLREVLATATSDALRVLAVTEVDLFIPMLTFIFGQAQLNGRVAVLSLARLRQEFYELPPNGALLCARARKEAVHEIGHTFGLTHCADQSCPMSLSNTINHVDRKGEDLCGGCSLILEEQMKHIRTDTGAEGKQ